MISFKPMLILYLIISSFTLSVCSTISEKDETIFTSIPKKVYENIKEHYPEITAASVAYTKAQAFEGLLTNIGKGISYACSSFYNILLESFGVKVAGVFVGATWIVAVAGTGYVIYKVVNSNHVIKVGTMEYSSSSEEENNSKNREWTLHIYIYI